MTTQALSDKWPIIDALAAAKGATEAARAKWRRRGVPYRWQVRLIDESNGTITAKDFRKSRSPDGATA